MKLKKLVTLFSAVSFTGLAIAEDSSKALQALEAQLNALQKEVAELRSAQSVTAKAVAPSAADDVAYASAGVGDFVTTSSVIGDLAFDGSSNLSSQSSIDRPRRMLQAMQKIENRADIDNSQPRLIFTGLFEGIADYTSRNSAFQGGYNSDVDVAGAQLGAVLDISKWVTGEISFEYDNSKPAGQRRTSNSNVKVRDAYAIIGNLNEYPVYAAVGQQKVGPGRFGSNFLASSPYTQRVFRQTVRALQVGGIYDVADEQTLYWNVYGYRPDIAAQSSKDKISAAGAALKYQGSFSNDMSVSAYVSGVTNMANADGVQSTASNESLVHNVPAVGAYLRVGYSDFTLAGEYITATKQFNADNWSYNNQGAKPRTANLELAYAFNIQEVYPASVALGYAKSWDALGIVPQSRYAATFNVSPFAQTVMAFELKREKDYAATDSSSVFGNAGTGTGNYANAATLYLSYFF